MTFTYLLEMLSNVVRPLLNAISEAEIDFVVHWGSYFETFSFTTYEAIAGGAYVTNPFSGNVASVVTQSCKGVVIPDKEGLLNFFKDDSAANITKIIRKNNAVNVCKLNVNEINLPFFYKKESI